MAKNMQTNIVLGGKVLPSLNNAFNQTNRKMLQVNKTSAMFSRATGTMSRSFGTAARFIGVDSLLMGAGFAYVGQKGLMLASDLKEVQNVVDVSFGKSSKIVDAWAKTTNENYGLAELQAKRFAGSMGAMLKSSGLAENVFTDMSMKLAGLAGDFASFYNLSHDEAWEKIRSGMAGETEPLKQLGINMSVANLEAFALSKGIKTAWSKMNQATQTSIRYAYLMQVSKDAQGDFTRTQGEFANQLRLSQNNFNKIISTVAGKFLPVANKGITWANKFMTSLDIDKVSQSFASFGDGVADVFKSYVQPALNWGINTGWPLFKDGVTTTYQAAKWFSDIVINNWPLIEPVLWGITGAMIGAKIATLGLIAAEKAGLIISALSKAWAAATFTIEWMRAGLSLATLAQWALNGAMAANPIGLITIAIGALGVALYALYKNWDSISNFMVSTWQNYILPFFKGVGAFFKGVFDGVANIFKGYVNIWISIANFLIGGLNKIKFTAPDWVPFVGGKTFGVTIPLIPKFAEGGFANQPSIFGEAGMEAAIPIKPGNPRSISLLNRTAQMLGVGGSSGPNVTFAPVINVSGGGNVKDRVQQGIEAAYPQFENIMNEYFGERRRLSFGQ